MAMTAQDKREARKAKRIAAAEAAKAAGQLTEIEKVAEAAMKNPGAVPDAHGEIAKPKKAGAKVTVGCKLGVAFIDLQLCKIVEKQEMSSQGAKSVNEAVRVGSVVRIRGTAYPRGTLPEGFPERPLMVAGAAMNPGVDKDWWDQWVEQNKLNPIVMNKMIFAHENPDFVAGVAKEQAENLSGLDPVNPKKNDPRVPKPNRPEVSGIEVGQRGING